MLAIGASCHGSASAPSSPQASSIERIADAQATSTQEDAGRAIPEASADAAGAAEAATKRRRGAAGRSACEAAAARAVNALPEIKKATARAMDDARASGGRAHFGGVGPIDDPDDGFTVGIGTHTNERFEAAAWYSVDGSGHLSVTVLGADLLLDADVLRRVERACRP
jgi:hypothetical protein